MKPDCTQIPLSSTGAFPKLLLDYLQKDASLDQFYNVFPDLEGFKNLIENRKFSKESRKVLVDELEKQYAELEPPPAIEAFLDEKDTEKEQISAYAGFRERGAILAVARSGWRQAARNRAWGISRSEPCKGA